MERVRGEARSVAACGQQAAEGEVEVAWAEAGGLEHGLLGGDLGGGGRRGARGGAALGSESDLGDPVVLDHERDPREIAAGRSACGAGEGARRCRALSPAVAQVALELVHDAEG
jgi:hypothetical protein